MLEDSFEDAAPLLGYQVEGDIETTFKLKPCPDFVEDVIEKYPGEQGQLTFSRELALPSGSEKPAAIFVHPGEPIFDTIRTRFLGEIQRRRRPRCSLFRFAN